jgi:hypothetical protein
VDVGEGVEVAVDGLDEGLDFVDDGSVGPGRVREGGSRREQERAGRSREGAGGSKEGARREHGGSREGAGGCREGAGGCREGAGRVQGGCRRVQGGCREGAGGSREGTGTGRKEAEEDIEREERRRYPCLRLKKIFKNIRTIQKMVINMDPRATAPKYFVTARHKLLKKINKSSRVWKNEQKFTCPEKKINKKNPRGKRNKKNSRALLPGNLAYVDLRPKNTNIP